jgi:hypothetical protein
VYSKGAFLKERILIGLELSPIEGYSLYFLSSV